MIEIDGSIGGGQIIRTSLSLSSLTGKPFKIINIRGKRENTGLRNQHLTAVNAMAEICGAQVKGNEIGSTTLEFIPSEVVANKYKFDIGTAGSTTLVLQTILPVLIMADKKSIIEIIGGTANPLAPPALEIKEVFLWYLKKLGINVHLEIIQEGFYPKGGGIIKVVINPCNELKELNLTKRDELDVKVNVFGVCSKDLKDKNISKRLIKGFSINFPIKYKMHYEELYVDSISSGVYIHVNYETINSKLGMTLLGEKGKKSEDLGCECARLLLSEIKSEAIVDFYNADQLLIYIALKGSGSIKVSHITDHMKTNINIIEKFLDVKFDIINNIITCFKQ